MANNDVADAFGDWLEALTADRTAGSYIKMIWVPEIPTVISFDGVVQNATPQDLQVVEEGLRTIEAIKVHTTTKLIAQEGSQTGDKINYDGSVWLVYNVAHRAIGNYHKAIAIKQ